MQDYVNTMIIIKTLFNNLSEHTTGWYRSDVFLVYKFHPFQCTRDEMYVLYHKVEASFEHFHLSHFCTKIAENSNDHQENPVTTVNWTPEGSA